MTAQNYKEKRRFPRACVQFDLVYKLNKLPEIHMRIGDEERSASLMSISESGMAILTNRPIPEATELEILFHLIFKDRQTPPMYAVGQVRYCTEVAAQKEYRLGIEFLNIDEGDKKTIAEFINSKT
ncbi:MAG: hypothetical protein AUJ74_00545 [Candidatus Omnitrophica bacterium CG1_02_44_16]|nr:MAG: hypothetical protein AUJ74_00545 [Candidatus Omnitrophica bacterium CG1_02_44_16]PIY83324.1 MAG: hypothetical protein COY78_02675 [Candidatus Omnitrophica bacterium CG_4_10_14_0_8_um_filter_44_12]PIZ84553.1 MAG: hypothetical protein COX96_03475 [Candidatus Omnitrophica bacterium CG_4_10_14_0_2_um_filter_44_9]